MRQIGKLIVAIGLSAIVATAHAAAQTRGQQDRKVIEKVAPLYPQLAKRMNIRGAVKLEVVIRPNGTVKSTKVVGGNPVLVDPAVDAVHKWKFEPASEETTGIIEVSFEPH